MGLASTFFPFMPFMYPEIASYNFWGLPWVSAELSLTEAARLFEGSVWLSPAAGKRIAAIKIGDRIRKNLREYN
jgi:hypothetical protein